MSNGKFSDMFEIAIFLAFIAVCLFCAFTSLHYTTEDVVAMQDSQIDTRHLQLRDSSKMDYSYLGRPGAYLDASRLAMSIGSASADRRADIRVLSKLVEPYDMFSLNVTSMEEDSPTAYNLLREWWVGFSTSEEYACQLGTACPLYYPAGGIRPVESVVCPTAEVRKYVYTNDAAKSRTFNPYHLNDRLSGYLFENPRTLDECKFKLQVVEIGIDCDGDSQVDCASNNCGVTCEIDVCVGTCTGKVVLEYHVFVFLGSLVSDRLGDTAQIEYRWYDCVIGDSTTPWVITD